MFRSWSPKRPDRARRGLVWAKMNEKGQSMVELALAMPVLILILAGILDLGRAYFTFITISDAAAEGAAYVAIHPDDQTQAVNRVLDASNGLINLDAAQEDGLVRVTIDGDDLTPGRPITVTVEYDYEIITPLISGFAPEGLTMRAVAVQPILGDVNP